MRRVIISTLMCTALLSLSNLSLAEPSQDYNAGMQAYASGNYTDALHIWTALAEGGHARAQFNLAYMYEFGIEVGASNEEAVKWYRRSAEQGYARAQNFLGWMYEMGKGVTPNRTEALKWLRAAAAQGGDDAAADYRLVLKRQQRADELKFREAMLETLTHEFDNAQHRYDVHKEHTPSESRDIEAANLTG